MCGIVGVYNLKETNRISSRILKRMRDSLIHRGPDDAGEYIDDKIALGHRRLSILDISQKGRQPMHDINKDIILTFNGEIYNFLEIKDILKEKGHIFNTKTDTEVIINSYKEWGIECINKFNGMFAFCLYDKKKNKIFLVRDRLGIKPLFYSLFENKLIFASEAKAILKFPAFPKKPNYKILSNYLSFRYPVGKESFFHGIYRMLPGEYIEISKNKISKHKYWDLPTEKYEKDLGEKYYLKKTRELLENSVKKRMISDVPLGAYLSGGLDSSIIVSIMAKNSSNPVKTYTIAFPQEEFNELEYAELVAKMYKTNHKEIMVDSSEYMQTMKSLIKFKDAPLAVPNEIPIHLMSKILKQDITVVLSGEGADEIFSGYGRLYRSPFDYVRLKKIPPNIRKKFIKSLGTKYKKSFKDELDHFLYQYDYFPDKKDIFNEYMKNITNNDIHIQDIFKQEFKKVKKLNYYDKISHVFEKLHLPGLLEKLDNPTMSVSVEGRVPFVDHELVEFSLTIPPKYKMKWNSPIAKAKAFFKNSDEISENLDTTKYILKKAFKKDLPKEILDRKKKGFPVPLDMWFKKDFTDYAKKLLLDKNARIKKIIDQKKLDSWINRKIRSNADKSFGQKLWMILNIELWLKEYFD